MLEIRFSCITIVCVSLIWTDGRIASASSASKKSKSFPQLFGIQPDSWVQAAPLVVAMACRDGVALVAAASSASQSSSGIDSEPLLYYSIDDNLDVSKNASTFDHEVVVGDDFENYPFLDFPDLYTGPHRIQSVGKIGAAAFASCGWKADGYIRLLNAAREFASAERNAFGEECNTLLPNQLSLFMAQCATSERVRELSCAALIAYVSDNDTSSKRNGAGCSVNHGCLWLVDVTGAYPVRAHCLGGGQVSITTEDVTMNNGLIREKTSTTQVADIINQELLALLRKSNISSQNITIPPCLPYFNMTTDDALDAILDLLSSKLNNINWPSGQLRQPGTRLEIASLQFKNEGSRMIRRRVSSVWGRRQKKKSVT